MVATMIDRETMRAAWLAIVALESVKGDCEREDSRLRELHLAAPMDSPERAALFAARRELLRKRHSAEFELREIKGEA